MGVSTKITPREKRILCEVADQYKTWVESETRARLRDRKSGAVRWPTIVAMHDGDRGSVLRTLLSEDLLERIGDELVMTPAAWVVIGEREPSIPEITPTQFRQYEKVVSTETGRVYVVESINIDATTHARTFVIKGINGKFTLTDNGMKAKMELWQADSKI